MTASIAVPHTSRALPGVVLYERVHRVVAIHLLVGVLLFAAGLGVRPAAARARVPDAPLTARFTIASFPTVGDGPQDVVSADFNGDGKADLVSADTAARTVTVLFGKGTGRFRARVAYRAGGAPARVAAADVDGDGDPDLLATLDDHAGSISVFIDTRAGQFRRHQGRATAGSPGYGLAAGDLDRDGRIDLVTAQPHRHDLTVLRGDGRGGFHVIHRYTGPRIRDVALGDVNGDRRLGRPRGSFGPAVASGTDGRQAAWGVALADFNHDRKLDLAASDRRNSIGAFLGNGDGTFVAAPRNPLPYSDYYEEKAEPDAVAIGDFNRDQNVDIAGSALYSGPYVIEGRGDGTFLPTRLLDADLGTIGAAVGDLRADGWPDLAFVYVEEGEEYPDLAVFLNRTGR